jgi:hypothetical protein
MAWERPAAMDADAKDKELLLLHDRFDQLKQQISILQKRIRKREKHPRYTLHGPAFSSLSTDIDAWTMPLERSETCSALT